MFEKDIQIIENITLPDETKRDIMDCIAAKIKYLQNETEDNLIDVKYSFDLAFTDIKCLQASHLLSPTNFSIIEHIIRKIDE